MVNIEYAATLVNPALTHVLEFGVGSGHTMRQCTASLKRTFPNKEFTIRGFDWFKGLPEAWQSTKYPGVIAAPAGAFTQNGIAPAIDGVLYYIGLFQDTLPAFIDSEAAPIALLHIDCDLYSSTKTVFEYLHPYIVKDTIIAFDEWCYLHDAKMDDHEAKAFFEYVEKYNISYE